MPKTCTTIPAAVGRETRDTAIRKWFSNPAGTLCIEFSPELAEAFCRGLAEALPEIIAAGGIISASCELRPADTAA